MDRIPRHSPRKGLILLLFLFSLVTAPGAVAAVGAIDVGAGEDGSQSTGQALVLHDTSDQMNVEQAAAALAAGQFGPLVSKGSTGLKHGAYWSYFRLHNTRSEPLSLQLEYVDHQLISLDAYNRPVGGDRGFEALVHLSMDQPFSQRAVEHNRFVVPLQLQPGETRELLVRFGSKESGYVYPGMRIWSPDNLAAQYVKETSWMSFLFGGCFLMGIFALVTGLSSGQKLFYVYSLYAFAKIASWATILGYTHQFLLREHFHWSLMSSTGATAILLGLVFARMFLQTRRHTPRFDYVLLFMIANGCVLLVAAIFQIKVVALLSITVALLMYPLVIIAGIIRWRQGEPEAGIFSIAWGLLVIGLMQQALRDLGLAAHTPFSYYWPPVASFTEMLTIMFAMGYRTRRLHQEREATEERYRDHLEQSKHRLEKEVKERTRELEMAKLEAEREARTDPLTGILNRRSFVHDADLRLKLAAREDHNCCLLMFDLDHFKSINDTHGHSVGDRVLHAFVEAVNSGIRETDVFGRIGGEEFALLVSGARESANLLAERLRADIASLAIPCSENLQTISVTTSIGLAFSTPDSTIEDLLHQGDNAMYRAKAGGRNRVVE